MGSLFSPSSSAGRFGVGRFVLALVAIAMAAPASAELAVTVSRKSVGQFESVGIVVRDPREGVEAKPGPILVTMADSSDHQHDLYLEPTGKPGEWSGRFTPMRAGRYTGTALLDRGDEKEIGLVPLIQVRRSGKRGFVRLHPGSKRTLRYASGATLFPVGVRLHPDDITGADWRTLFTRLRASEVNYVEVPVAFPTEEAAANSVNRSVDAALVEAERTGRMAVQLRLLPPADLTGEGALAYEGQLQRWVRRWGYSPAVAAFYVAGATPEVAPDLRQRWVRAVRAVDPYRHLVALPGANAPGGDIQVLPWNWQRPAHRFALIEVPDKLEGPAPLPGESSWQMLVLGGVGLPLWPYRPGAPDSAAVLGRISKLANAAGRIPYQTTAHPLTDVVSVDTPGSFCRYGKTTVGWVAPDADRVLNLSALPRGRYRVSFWDPAQDAPAGSQEFWSTGSSARVELPKNLKAVYVQAEPIANPPAAKKKPAPRKVVAKAPTRKPVKRVAAKPVKKPAKKLTRAQQRRANRLAAAKKAAAAKKLAAAKKAASRRAAAKKRSSTRTASRKKAPAKKKAPVRTTTPPRRRR